MLLSRVHAVYDLRRLDSEDLGNVGGTVLASFLPLQSCGSYGLRATAELSDVEGHEVVLTMVVVLRHVYTVLEI